MPENKKDKEERGTGILPVAEHDELEACEMENISGGTPATTPPPKPPGTVIAIIGVLIG